MNDIAKDSAESTIGNKSEAGELASEATTDGEADEVEIEPEPSPEPETQETGAPKAWQSGWLGRKSLHALRKEFEPSPTEGQEFDQAANEASRLPQDEDVHLIGVVLAEVFTPSTVSALYKALREFPTRSDRTNEWIARLTKSRTSAGSGGWSSLGSVRNTDGFFTENIDPELPSEVEAAWPSISYLTPSLTVVVTTFTIKAPCGDLSG